MLKKRQTDIWRAASILGKIWCYKKLLKSTTDLIKNIYNQFDGIAAGFYPAKAHIYCYIYVTLCIIRVKIWRKLSDTVTHVTRLVLAQNLNLKTNSLSLSELKAHIYGAFIYIEVIGLIHPPSENFGSGYYHPKSDGNWMSHTSQIFEAAFF